jgi:hypothetical protein
MPDVAEQVITARLRPGLLVLGIGAVSALLLSHSAPTLAADPPASFAYVAEYNRGAANGVQIFQINPATGSLISHGFAPSVWVLSPSLSIPAAEKRSGWCAQTVFGGIG